ncbi:MAG: A24 family peptidase [archaeon]
MIADWIFIGVAIAGTAVGTVTDLKGRWVPDWVSYFMIIFGLSGHALLSLTLWSIWPMVYSAAAAGVLYGLSSLLFYMGVWGGGDAKLFVGYGALLPVFVPAVSAPWPWLVTLWVNTLVFGVVFGILGAIFLAFKYRVKFIPELRNQVRKNRIALYIAPAFLVFPFLMYSLNLSVDVFALSFLLVLFPIVYIILKAVEGACMFKHLPPSKLVEGDWVVEEVHVGNYSYKPSKSGIEKKDIEKLVELEKHGKLKQIKVKEGMPYVPALLTGLIVSIFYGDIMFSAIMGFLA